MFNNEKARIEGLYIAHGCGLYPELCLCPGFIHVGCSASLTPIFNMRLC